MPDATTCVRWWSVPWYDCQAQGAWRVFPFQCEIHDPCLGHLFCQDHIVSPVLTDPAYRDGVQRIERVLPDGT